MDDKLKKELAEGIARINKNQLLFDVGPNVPKEIEAAIILLHEVSDVSTQVLNKTAKTIQLASGLSAKELAAALHTWSDGSLDQPPPVDKEMSLSVGYLASFYMHCQLCDTILQGPTNIANVVLAMEEMQKVLFRLARAGLQSDPISNVSRTINETLKGITKDANDKRREQGRLIREQVEAEYNKLKNKGFGRQQANFIANKTELTLDQVRHHLRKMEKEQGGCNDNTPKKCNDIM